MAKKKAVKKSEVKPKPFLRNGYAFLFTLSIALLIGGYSLPTIGLFIPEIDYGDPGYEDYISLMETLDALPPFLHNTGLMLFTLSTFMAAMVENRFSKEVKKTLINTSCMGLISFLVTILNFIPYIGSSKT